MTSVKYKFLLLLLFISIMTFIVVFPSIPLYGNAPLSDSAVFVYIAKEMLHGKVPYIDIWDHKPPGIYMINIIGILLQGKSYWGIWLMEYLSILIASYLSFTVLKKSWGELSAFFATFLWLSNLVFLYEHGNSTEFYGLSFQFFALYLLVKVEKSIKLKYFFFLGCALVGAFLLRYNLIALYIVIFFYIFLKGIGDTFTKSILRIIAYLLGIIFCLIPFILFFYLHNSLSEFISATLFANIYYSAAPFILRVFSAMMGLKIFLITGIIIYAIFGWFVGSRAIKKGKKIPGKGLLVVALIDFPLEIMCSSISGRMYPHYYASWLPSLAILTAYFFYWYRANIFSTRNFLTLRKIQKILLVVLLITTLLVEVWYSIYTFSQNLLMSREALLVSEKIKKTTKTGKKILVWGLSPSIYLQSERLVAGKYLYQSPLYLKGYKNEKMTRDFYNDLEKDPPVYIIDTTTIEHTIPSFVAERRKRWISRFMVYENNNDLQSVYSFIEQNYYLSEVVPNGWRIYKLGKPISL